MIHSIGDMIVSGVRLDRLRDLRDPRALVEAARARESSAPVSLGATESCSREQPIASQRMLDQSALAQTEVAQTEVAP